MWAIINSEYFWGTIIGFVLSFFGSWLLAKFTVAINTANARLIVARFCVDVIRNIQGIVFQLEDSREKFRFIDISYLRLLDDELAAYNRNRDQLIILPDSDRVKVRKFFNDIAIRRTEIIFNLEKFNNLFESAKRIDIEAGNDESAIRRADGLRTDANIPLQHANNDTDRLLFLARDAAGLIESLSRIK